MRFNLATLLRRNDFGMDLMAMDAMATNRSYLTRWSLVLVLLALVPSTGCLHLLLATGIYMWEGGNLAPAECEALEGKRLVVFCRQPSSHEFRHAGASRQIASKITGLFAMNVPGADVVHQKHVDNWIDENDSDDYEQLGKAVKADMVVYVDLGHFELFKGKTVYQGNSDVTVQVFDMEENAKLVYEKELGEVLYPVHSGIAVQDKPKSTFQKEFVGVIADQVARNFYKHDPHASFALDAMANN